MTQQLLEIIVSWIHIFLVIFNLYLKQTDLIMLINITSTNLREWLSLSGIIFKHQKVYEYRHKNQAF